MRKINATKPKTLNIVLAVQPQSPFNASIWLGLAHGFQELGHQLKVVDSRRCPLPSALVERPDLFLAVHGGSVPLGVVERYRAHGVMTGVYLLDEPYEVDRTVQWARHYDYVFSVDQVTLPVHRQHTKAAFLPLAFSDAVFGTEGEKISSDVLVLGSAYKAREIYLSALRDDFGPYVTWVGPGWKGFSSLGVHHENYVGPVDCARFYRGAKLVINIHRDSIWSHFGELNTSNLIATHLNSRFWESTACGALSLTSYREDIEVFAPNAPTFNDEGSFLALVEKYLHDDHARDEKAKSLVKTVEPHTYKSRANQIIDTIF